jgi:hypothetical protein
VIRRKLPHTHVGEGLEAGATQARGIEAMARFHHRDVEGGEFRQRIAAVIEGHAQGVGHLRQPGEDKQKTQHGGARDKLTEW